jgi:predicted dehydrogenase
MQTASGSQTPAAPQVDYQPRDPQSYNPPIGLIGCGGITDEHLAAYRKAGYRVVALCDIDRSRAEKRREEFYPAATIYTDYRSLLRRIDVEVVDIATHAAVREKLIEEALHAQKHVLSQKPFVLDLDAGEKLVELADRNKVKLAVNQNGRWAPHFSYAAAAIRAGFIGDVQGVHMSVHWDHRWVRGTEFEKVKHLILYDYAIHWFDILQCFITQPAKRVHASTAKTPDQEVKPPLLGQALIEFETAQASLAFDAATPFGQQDRTYISGSRGSISSVGTGNRHQTLTLTTAAGQWQPELHGCWFPDGFHGTMGELLRSIEENRQPTISAANNLQSLALCFAAVASSERHEPVVPGSVRQLMIKDPGD